MGLISGSGGSPGEGNGNAPQYSCMEKPMDREAWQDHMGLKGDISEHTHSHADTETSSKEKKLMINDGALPSSM